jgi:flagellar protein FliT
MTQEHGQDQVQLVERVFELTQAMEHAVNLADWRHAARLGEERSPLLQSIQANQQPRSRELVRRIQAIGDAILRDASRAQSELASEYRGAMDRAGTVKAYHRAALL